MTFQSLGFLAFAAVTLGVCLPLGRRHRRAGRWALTAASAAFCVSGGGWGALWVLAAGACVTALALEAMDGAAPRRRRRAAAAAACWHIAVLAGFKYTAFFTGGAVTPPAAPLGLSFFTFQQLWLLKEACRGSVPRLGPGKLALYALFFPTVTSGPILRPGDFFPQLEGEGFLRPSWRDGAAGLYALSLGMAKKVLLADAFGAVADSGWADPGALSAPGAWLVILAYTLQLYFDFSGYCDIAAGLARLLGIRLPVNFDSPYRACSVGEFWKRWHITLTTFLRECVYFPLGGSRRGPARTYGNILAVFLISGLWHGAGWTFLVWGALHGLGQIFERAVPARERLPRWIRWAGTFLFVNLAWVFFRAPDLAAAGEMLRSAFAGGAALPDPSLWAGLLTSEMDALAVLAPGMTSAARALAALGLYGVGLTAALAPGNTIRRMDTFRPAAWRCLALAALLAWSVLSFTGITTFIYSNF